MKTLVGVLDGNIIKNLHNLHRECAYFGEDTQRDVFQFYSFK